MSVQGAPKPGEKWQNVNPTTGDVLNVTVIKTMGGEPPSVLYRRQDTQIGRIELEDFFRMFRRVS